MSNLIQLPPPKNSGSLGSKLKAVLDKVKTFSVAHPESYAAIACLLLPPYGIYRVCSHTAWSNTAKTWAVIITLGWWMHLSTTDEDRARWKADKAVAEVSVKADKDEVEANSKAALAPIKAELDAMKWSSNYANVLTTIYLRLSYLDETHRDEVKQSLIKDITIERDRGNCGKPVERTWGTDDCPNYTEGLFIAAKRALDSLDQR